MSYNIPILFFCGQKRISSYMCCTVNICKYKGKGYISGKGVIGFHTQAGSVVTLHTQNFYLFFLSSFISFVVYGYGVTNQELHSKLFNSNRIIQSYYFVVFFFFFLEIDVCHCGTSNAFFQPCTHQTENDFRFICDAWRMA